ncbi:MAG TPA: hypothetical protein VFX76_00355 [Roseiflexaceae bacterium]|nr:hypothetical protein [Roseiflexaceae bacterium]
MTTGEIGFDFLPGTDLGVSKLTATVFEVANPPSVPADLETKVIRTDQAWGARIQFETTGAATSWLTGTWHVGLYLESIGPGPELELGIQHVPLTPGANPAYDVTLNVPAGAVGPVPDHQTRPFKLVTCVSYMMPDDTPGPMAGYIEGPILQFYNP